MEPVPEWKSSLPAYFTEHYSDHTQGWKAQCFQIEVLEDEVRGCKNIWKITLEKFQDRGNLRRIWGMERKDHNLHLNAIQITTQFSKCWCMGEIPRSWAENSTWKECKSRRVWRLVLSKLNRLMDTASFLSKESLPWKKRQCHSTKRLAFPGGAAGKEHACQSRRQKRCGFDFWVEKIPWRRKWQPTPAFLPVESHGQRSLAGYSPWDCRAGHDWSDWARMQRPGRTVLCRWFTSPLCCTLPLSGSPYPLSLPHFWLTERTLIPFLFGFVYLCPASDLNCFPVCSPIHCTVSLKIYFVPIFYSFCLLETCLLSNREKNQGHFASSL